MIVIFVITQVVCLFFLVFEEAEQDQEDEDEHGLVGSLVVMVITSLKPLPRQE